MIQEIKPLFDNTIVARKVVPDYVPKVKVPVEEKKEEPAFETIEDVDTNLVEEEDNLDFLKKDNTRKYINLVS